MTTSSALARVMATLKRLGLRQKPTCWSASPPPPSQRPPPLPLSPGRLCAADAAAGGRLSGLDSTCQLETHLVASHLKISLNAFLLDSAGPMTQVRRDMICERGELLIN